MTDTAIAQNANVQNSPDPIAGFGARLKAAANAAGMGEVSLSKQTGIPYTCIRDAINTDTVTLRNAAILARAVGVSLDHLAFGASVG